MRTVVVGDVHGCLDELLELAARCGAPGDTRYVMVGDLVAKGPDSQGVLQWARESGVEAVLGNHDARLLHVRDNDKDHPPKSQHVVVAKTLKPQDWRWLESLPFWIKIGPSHLVVHAGLVPDVPLANQETKHLLNIRSITHDGQPSSKVEGRPWAASWKGPRHVVFGHDAIRGLQLHEWATGLDTGCVYGRTLTGLVLPDHEIVSVPARRAYSPFVP
jgi:hypothetical protein